MLSKEALDHLLKQLGGEEAYKEFPYDDATGEEVRAPKGNLTVGVGFNLSSGCPRDLANIIATYFINKNDAQLARDLDFYDMLDEVRKCVILDLSFNMGVHGVEAFKTTLNLISQGFYKNAAAQLRKSAWYSQVPRRAEPLCYMMETGNWTLV